MRTALIVPDMKYVKNIANSFRSAEAFGVNEILLIGDENMKLLEKKRRVMSHAMTYLKHMKTKRFDTHEECIEYLINEGLKIICIENDKKSKSLLGYKFPDDIAFIMGHEAGVPEEYLKIGEHVRIPQFGLTQCLNTTVAMSIVLYERFKQALKL